MDVKRGRGVSTSSGSQSTKETLTDSTTVELGAIGSIGGGDIFETTYLRKAISANPSNKPGMQEPWNKCPLDLLHRYRNQQQEEFRSEEEPEEGAAAASLHF